MKVFGIDIIHGSVRSWGKRPRFALFIREDGQERETTEVSVFRLLRLIARDKPDILAVDSVQGIARDQQALFSFLQFLPPQTMLVKAAASLSRDAIRQVEYDFGIVEGDIIVVKMTAGWGTTVLDTLAGFQIQAFIGGGNGRLKDACLERGIVLSIPKRLVLKSVAWLGVWMPAGLRQQLRCGKKRLQPMNRGRNLI